MKDWMQIVRCLITGCVLSIIAFHVAAKEKEQLKNHGIYTIAHVTNVGGVGGAIYADYTFLFRKKKYFGSSTVPEGVINIDNNYLVLIDSTNPKLSQLMTIKCEACSFNDEWNSIKDFEKHNNDCYESICMTQMVIVWCVLLSAKEPKRLQNPRPPACLPDSRWILHGPRA